MMKRKEFMLGAIAGLTFAAAATAGGVIDWPSANAGPVAGFTGRLSPDNGGAGLAFAPPQGAPLSFADIFEQVAPAVVQIDVKTRVPRSSMIQIPGTPFAIPNPNGGDDGEEGTDGEGATALGAGSGFFISADGFIVTNNHVVADAIEITVKLADGREMEARVVGRDELTDLAVIKVEGSDFPFVTFEEQAEPRVGDWVIAVGNPFGLGGTATAGIVSAKGRRDGTLDRRGRGYVDFLQIDAAINTGNSGGPTFDIYGRVIGVNSAILSPGMGGGSVGIGFAIPASVAKPITDQLVQSGQVQRGYVGLGLRTFTPEQWEAYGQPRDFEGALVESVTPGGPAERGGARIDDIVVAVNGTAVADSVEATRLVGSARPGETIRIEVLRDGRRQTLSVRAGTRPSEEELNADSQNGQGTERQPAPPAAEGAAVEGVSVAPLTAALRQRFGVAAGATGVVIVEIARNTPAARLGLEVGMVITRADRREVRSAADLREAVEGVRRAGRPGVLLYILTPQGTAPVVLPFDDRD